MTNPQLIIYLKRLEERLDLAITVARQELATINESQMADTDQEIEGLIDHGQDGFRDKSDLPVIPALTPFEDLSRSLGKDIEILSIE